MLGLTFKCAKIVTGMMLVSAMLTACGGGAASDLPATQDTAQSSAAIEISSATNVASSTPIVTSSKSTVSVAKSSVGNLTDENIKIRSSASSINSSKAPLVAVNSSATVVVTISSTFAISKNINTVSGIASSSKAATNSSASAISSKTSSAAISSKANSSVAISSSKANSSVTISSKASSSVAVSSSKASSVSSSKSSSSSSSSIAAGILGATIQWSPPTARENGSYLNLDEIGGYQIRYKALNATGYSYISIPGNSTTNYKFPSSIIGLQFEIAVYDNQGLYSDFVPITSN